MVIIKKLKREWYIISIKIPYEENHKFINGILYKKCSRHYNYFPEEDAWLPCTLEYFHKNKSSSKDGLNTWCKRCASLKAKEWNYDPKHKQTVDKSIKNRNNSEAQKKRNADFIIKRRESGYFKKYYESNPELFKQYNKKHSKKEHRLTKQEWQSCKEYFNNTCAYCGLPLEEHYITYKGKIIKSDFHKEHVIDTGRNDIKNCIPSCSNCNSKKWEKTLNEWYNKNNPVYTYERYHKIYMWIRYDCHKYIEKKKPKRQYIRKAS
jgi:hypothetical protein